MTWTPSQEILDAALAHAGRDQPREACGIVIDDQYIPIKNNATDTDSFAMDRDEFYTTVKGRKLGAVVHSHVYSPAIASQGDLTMCEITAVPWLIVSWPLGKWAVIEPSGYVAPLIGRQWCWGSLDCWSLVRDAFKAFTGIQMPNVERAEWEWWRKKGGYDLIADNIEAVGLVNLGQDVVPRHCDIIALQIMAEVPNHMGIFLEPDNVFLHHPRGRRSLREVYGGVYQKATRYVLRHELFLEEMPPLPKDRSVWTGEIRGQEVS